MTDNLATQLTHRLFQRLRRVQVRSRAASPAAQTSPTIAAIAHASAAAGVAEVASAAPASATGPTAPRRNAALRVPGARCRVDPADGQRTLISGRMNEVCDALDRLIAHQAIGPAQIGFTPTRV